MDDGERAVAEDFDVAGLEGGGEGVGHFVRGPGLDGLGIVVISEGDGNGAAEIGDQIGDGIDILEAVGDEVAGDGDQVVGESVDVGDDFLEMGEGHVAAGVEVGEVEDAEILEGGREIGERHGEFDVLRFEWADEAGVSEGSEGHKRAAEKVGEGAEVFLEPGAALGDKGVGVFFLRCHGAGLCGLESCCL